MPASLEKQTVPLVTMIIIINTISIAIQIILDSYFFWWFLFYRDLPLSDLPQYFTAILDLQFLQYSGFYYFIGVISVFFVNEIIKHYTNHFKEIDSDANFNIYNKINRIINISLTLINIHLILSVLSIQLFYYLISHNISFNLTVVVSMTFFWQYLLKGWFAFFVFYASTYLANYLALVYTKSQVHKIKLFSLLPGL